jgi:precorrin-8X/cobalt-precorrin-8 methylmutase
VTGGRLFDRYVFVDWSGSASPNWGKDSIWFANGTADQTAPPENPRTREKATAELRKILVDAVDAEERVLIGFDFPYGYPAGFSVALQLDSSDAPWRATWSFLREFVHDGPGNVSCRFKDAAELNRRIGSPPGPFWGHTPGFQDPALVWRASFPFQTQAGQTLHELRHTERHLRDVKRTAWPVWKLAGQGGVGSQALLGIPRVAALRDDPELADISLVWPFETRFSVGAVRDRGPFILHAEIWPSVLELDPESHDVSDARQVLAMVEWARRLDGQGHLHREFEAPTGVGEQKLDNCLREEGWILGATTATRPDGSKSTPAVKGRGEHRADENVRHIEALHQTGVIDDDERDELLGRVDRRGSDAPNTLGQS